MTTYRVIQAGYIDPAVYVSRADAQREADRLNAEADEELGCEQWGDGCASVMEVEVESPAEKLIQRSISHTEIVYAPYSAELAAELAAACEDSADADRAIEYWGTTEDGDEWRVHLAREEAR